jgi:hypothetical protein
MVLLDSKHVNRTGELRTKADVPESCPDCGPSGMRVVWQRFRNQTLHLRVECDGCGRFVTYLRQSRAAVLLADLDTSEQTRLALGETIGVTA